MADDDPVHVALVATGEDAERWSEWLNGSGARAAVCEHVAEALARRPRPSVIVVDSLVTPAPGDDRLAVDAGVPVIVIGSEYGTGSGTHATATHLSRQVSRHALVGAVLALSAGLSVRVPPTARGRPMSQPSARESLDWPASDDDGWTTEPPTAREREVLALAALGLTNRTIAARLRISDHTVKFHLASVYAKLGARGRTQAVRRAIRRGWIAI